MDEIKPMVAEGSDEKLIAKAREVFSKPSNHQFKVVKSMQKPSVGRIVHYFSYGTPNGEYKSEARAAVITAVQDDETVSLAVFNPTGIFLNQNVKRGQNGGQWDWPKRV